jgi:hypothetical protein
MFNSCVYVLLSSAVIHIFVWIYIINNFNRFNEWNTYSPANSSDCVKVNHFSLGSIFYGGWFGTLLCVVPNGALSDFCLVFLSLTMHDKRRVIVQRVVAMSHCRSAQIKGWAICRMTTRRLALIASDKTKRR